MSNRRIALTAIIASGVAVLLGCTTAGWVTWTYDPPPGAERPNVTDWMQGWGSMAAVLAGIVAAGITAALLLHEMREARRARELLANERRDAEMASARAVVVGQIQISPASSSGGISQVKVGITNYGPGPILEVEVNVHVGEEVIASESFLVIGSRQAEVVEDLADAGEPMAANLTLTEILTRLKATVTFTDMNGLRWRRRGTDQPERILETPKRLNQPAGLSGGQQRLAGQSHVADPADAHAAHNLRPGQDLVAATDQRALVIHRAGDTSPPQVREVELALHTLGRVLSPGGDPLDHPLLGCLVRGFDLHPPGEHLLKPGQPPMDGGVRLHA